MTHTLYAADVSLFSGKARSYLRWKNVDFKEVAPTPEVMKTVLLPVIGWPVIPVLGLPDGSLVQDTGDIIAHVEANHPGPSVYPDGPIQRFVTELIHTYADQWLTLPAMHYRWNHNEAWVLEEFGRLAAPNADRETQIAIGTKRGAMFRAMVPALGITPETAPAIEASYLACLSELNTHFQRYHFVFGGRPTLADFALYGPLYAHLYRDPASGALMKTRAPHVTAWVERLRDRTYAETELIEEDWIPESLLAILRRHHREHLPVLVATNAALGAFSGDELPRVLGRVPFTIDGVSGQTLARPFSLFRLQAALEIYARLSESDRAQADSLLDATDGGALKNFRLARGLVRKDYKLALA